MRRIIKILLVSLMMLMFANNISADTNHIIVNIEQDLISEEQIIELEQDLINIEDKYDISVFFVFDESIGDTNTSLLEYAREFANNNFIAENNNVGLFINNGYYYIAASGTYENVIEKNQEDLWSTFLGYISVATNSEDEMLKEGIRAFYQKCVSLINENAYTPSTPTVIDNPFVNDFADLFTDEQEYNLNKKLLAYKNKYGLDAVIVTTDSTNGMNIQDYADDFYDYNNYNKDGLIFVICMSDRSWHFSTKGKGVEYFTDYGIDEIFDDMKYDLADGYYYNAFDTFADDVRNFTESALNGEIIDVHNDPPTFGIGNVAIAAVIGAIASLITMGVLRGQLKSVSRKVFARDYVVDDSFVLTGASDLFVNRHVTRTRKPERDVSSGGGGFSGGSSIHTSSSGSSHGGHGGHF